MNETSITVRRALPADADSMANLLRQLGYERSGTDLQSALEDDSQVVLVAERPFAVPDPEAEARAGTDAATAVPPGSLLGLIVVRVRTYFHLDDPVGAIDVLVVDERARSLGIGRALLDAVEAEARDAGCRTLELHSNLRRERARSFYERAGFVVTSNHYARHLGEPRDD